MFPSGLCIELHTDIPRSVEGLLKDDLVDALVEHLEANETTFGKQSQFNDFYKRTGSPIKRERVSPPDASSALSVSKPRRRQTKLIENNLDSYVDMFTIPSA